MQQQAENAERLADSLSLTYEELVRGPADAACRLEAFLPEIGRIDLEQRFRIHAIGGVVERGVVDLDPTKIARCRRRTSRRSIGSCGATST